MSIDEYLPEEFPKKPHAIKLNLDHDQSIIDALKAFKGPHKNDYMDDSKNILAVDAYGVVNGGIDNLETAVDDQTFFEPENTYSVYPGTGIRKQNMQEPQNHDAIDVNETLSWTERDQGFKKLLSVANHKEDLDNDDLYYVTDIGAFDTTIAPSSIDDSTGSTPTTIPLMRHERVQAFNGYTVFLDWGTSDDLDRLKIEDYDLEDWMP